MPDFAAGHSLGEYTVAAAVGAISVDDGIELVSLRGRLMAEIQSERPGAMAAVIGLSADALEALCDRGSEDSGIVTLANLNSPTQIVISGEEAAVERVMELAGEAGATRVVRLQVGAAFHSELMRPVARADGRGRCRGRVERPESPGRRERLGRSSRTAMRSATPSSLRSRALSTGSTVSMRSWRPAARRASSSGRDASSAGSSARSTPAVDVFSADSPARLDEFAAARA